MRQSPKAGLIQVIHAALSADYVDARDMRRP